LTHALDSTLLITILKRILKLIPVDTMGSHRIASTIGTITGRCLPAAKVPHKKDTGAF